MQTHSACGGGACEAMRSNPASRYRPDNLCTNADPINPLLPVMITVSEEGGIAILLSPAVAITRHEAWLSTLRPLVSSGMMAAGDRKSSSHFLFLSSPACAESLWELLPRLPMNIIGIQHSTIKPKSAIQSQVLESMRVASFQLRCRVADWLNWPGLKSFDQ